MHLHYYLCNIFWIITRSFQSICVLKGFGVWPNWTVWENISGKKLWFDSVSLLDRIFEISGFFLDVLFNINNVYCILFCRKPFIHTIERLSNSFSAFKQFIVLESTKTDHLRVKNRLKTLILVWLFQFIQSSPGFTCNGILSCNHLVLLGC